MSEIEHKKKYFFHPFSGIAILGMDWLAFGAEVPTGFSSVVLVSVAAFLVTFVSVYVIQSRDGDSFAYACLKALIGATAAGVPFPVTGTILGTAILVLSGLPTGRFRR